MWFEALSRFKINKDKSELIPMGRVVHVEDLAIELGCKVREIPATYLGQPLGAPFRLATVWDVM